jgi:MFS family permease
MAIILGLMNGASMITGAIMVLYAQEVLEIGPVLFTVLFFGMAVGGLIGGNVASAVSSRLGSGTCLAMTLGGMAIIPTIIGLLPWWPLVMVLMGVVALLGMLWNVITVSLRQSIIPAHLLGRVNSVYRFFAWGMMPIGATVGGLTVWVLEQSMSREWALRSTWFAQAIVYAGLFAFGRAKLTTNKIERARAEAVETPGDPVQLPQRRGR